MKPIWESAETFAAYGIIDCCHYAIKELQTKVNKPRAPIARMIDAATGYDKHTTKENIKTFISLLRQIVKQKKIIEADYSEQQKMIKELQSELRKIKP